jgi:hypothetical protein
MPGHDRVLESGHHVDELLLERCRKCARQALRVDQIGIESFRLQPDLEPILLISFGCKTKIIRNQKYVLNILMLLIFSNFKRGKTIFCSL